MCGIAGIVRRKSPPTQSELNAMVDALEHRGPDDRGCFRDGPLAFGMRRLSIIDISSGQQPIQTADGRYTIVFNGEIYNYQTVRKQLLESGHQFKTNSDTEAILLAYQEFGEECLALLQGMFAFAIWDSKTHELFAARDRWGIKPFFYSWDGAQFLFSSELKSFYGATSLTLSAPALNHFFSFLYFPSTFSPYAEIQKLLPGHFLRFRDDSLEIKQYYSPANCVQEHTIRTEEEWIDAFFEVARSVMEIHLLSEVPLGAFLSGGIDSSLLVGIMSELLEQPVNTFSIGYEHGGELFDERSYARIVANHFSTNHRELLVAPETVQSRLPEILNALDEPFGDASVIPNYLLSEFTHQYVTVAISGLGGDEVCAGYERHLGALLAERHPLLSLLVSNPLSQSLLTLLPDSRRGAHLPERLKRFAEAARLPLSERYFSFISKFSSAQKAALFSTDFQSQISLTASEQLFEAYWSESGNCSALSKVLQMEMQTYLVDDLLTLSDRTSMAHSIEMRVPFVDHTLVEFFQKVPDNLKLRGFEKKYLLKKAAERLLPHEVIYRKKAGFSVPLSIWFRNELKSYLYDTLCSQSVRELGLFEQSYIETLLKEHCDQTRNHDERLFALLSFVVWQKQSGASL